MQAKTLQTFLQTLGPFIREQISRGRSYLYEYKLPGQDKPRLEKAVNADFVPFIRGVRGLRNEYTISEEPIGLVQLLRTFVNTLVSVIKSRAKTLQPPTCHVPWSGIRWSSKCARTKEWGGPLLGDPHFCCFPFSVVKTSGHCTSPGGSPKYQKKK